MSPRLKETGKQRPVPRTAWVEVYPGFVAIASNSPKRGGREIVRRKNMRSDLIFGALAHVSNRYQLCQLASKATRKLHKPNTRLQDTTNDVLARFHSTNRSEKR